jgi:undecaprenyl pyrophosphate phosphatase UppP
MNKALKPSRVRVVAETAIALFASALGVLTIFWHDWIEALTGWDPDHYNGGLEWMIVAVLLVIAAAVGATARRDWRLRAAASQSPS